MENPQVTNEQITHNEAELERVRTNALTRYEEAKARIRSEIYFQGMRRLMPTSCRHELFYELEKN